MNVSCFLATSNAQTDENAAETSQSSKDSGPDNSQPAATTGSELSYRQQILCFWLNFNMLCHGLNSLNPLTEPQYSLIKVFSGELLVFFLSNLDIWARFIHQSWAWIIDIDVFRLAFVF